MIECDNGERANRRDRDRKQFPTSARQQVACAGSSDLARFAWSFASAWQWRPTLGCWWSLLSFGWFQDAAGRPRMVWIGRPPSIDLLAQVGDVELYDVCLPAEVVVPDAVEDLCPLRTRFGLRIR